MGGGFTKKHVKNRKLPLAVTLQQLSITDPSTVVALTKTSAVITTIILEVMLLTLLI